MAITTSVGASFSIATPYEGQFITASAPIAANTVCFGPVTRSTLILAAQLYWGTLATQSGGIAIIHDPSTGPAGTGSSIVGSALLISTSGAGAAFNWALTGSTQMNPGDWLTLQVTGSSVGLSQLRLTIQALPN